MTDEQVRRRIATAGAVAWMVVIFGFSALPGSAVPGRFGELGHFGLYFVLGALYVMALGLGDRPLRAALLAVALAALYGVSDEFHQSFVPGRVPDIFDVMVDVAGALTAAGSLLVIAWWRRRRR